MVMDCLNSLLIRKYHGYKVYIHNMFYGEVDHLIIIQLSPLKSTT